MEGAESLKADKATILIFVIILFHAVGLAGFTIDTLQPFFLQIVPFHLLLMLVIVCISHNRFNARFILFMLIIAVAGYGVEWLGVHKNWLFGNYTYGQTLGLKWNDIPLIVAVNWLLLVYATGVFLQYLPIRSVIARITIGAFVMMMLDVIIEPVAVQYDYWHWHSDTAWLTAPVGNYVTWFLVSAAMLGIFEAFKFKNQSSVGIILLATQFVFFFILLSWI
jgi:putative membrane protein